VRNLPHSKYQIDRSTVSLNSEGNEGSGCFPE
jgi:hypothetical protein